MGLYLEESSMVDSSISALIEPTLSAEQIRAAVKTPRYGRRGAGKFFRQGTARPEDAIPPGTCPRCGRVADHATSEDCIEQVGASNIARDITERKVAEKKAVAQLARLSLLNQITRAIGGREDLGSIYRIVLHSLEEDLGFDFGCICDYDPTSGALTVLQVDARSQPLAW
jgi:hypothetical protein